MLSIREAREADLPSIYRLSDAINMEHHVNMPKDFIKPDGNHDDESYWRRFLEDDSSAVFVAERNANVVGVISVSVSNKAPFPFLVSRPRAYVATIVLDKAFRGQGIGRHLMSAAEDFAKAKGASDIRLEVMAFNASALAFYEELGYENMSYRLMKPLF
ncbi:GNAT family N-acetyltransferase [Halomonas sp. ML-15]|uniref:GNAT family N-acetyltransferase n=1 Tax=Halomonas sp. ML-15 TaxID=2773305 RepID=UPI001747BA69|nr:N-acetyltransferase [Halomonas sp. ML-15]MBD3894995.1 GNAT family N-acetyltransferase [Halomonas sp. ML-15]